MSVQKPQKLLFHKNLNATNVPNRYYTGNIAYVQLLKMKYNIYICLAYFTYILLFYTFSVKVLIFSPVLLKY
jgi:hypothetical protein